MMEPDMGENMVNSDDEPENPWGDDVR